MQQADSPLIEMTTKALTYLRLYDIVREPFARPFSFGGTLVPWLLPCQENENSPRTRLVRRGMRMEFAVSLGYIISLTVGLLMYDRPNYCMS
jgi:hypothetical protein